MGHLHRRAGDALDRVQHGEPGAIGGERAVDGRHGQIKLQIARIRRRDAQRAVQSPVVGAKPQMGRERRAIVLKRFVKNDGRVRAPIRVAHRPGHGAHQLGSMPADAPDRVRAVLEFKRTQPNGAQNVRRDRSSAKLCICVRRHRSTPRLS
jgi:hypothetical protein